MRRRENVPAPRGRTYGAVWKGAGASLLLHLVVAGALIASLPGPPTAPSPVVDLTLLPPGVAGRRPAVPAAGAAKPAMASGTAVLPAPPALPASPTVAKPPGVAAPASPPGPEAIRNLPIPGPPPSTAAVPAGTAPGPATTEPGPAATGDGPVRAAAGSPPGAPGAGPLANFTWIRDAIQHAIAYPPAARRMGWEGKVVVAFRLLSDGSVRDVRVVQGSGHASLDRGAIDAVRNASPFPRVPAGAEVITPVVYRLTPR